MGDALVVVFFLVVVYVVVVALVFLRKRMGKNRKRKEGWGEERGGGEVMGAVFAGIAAYEESLKGGRIRKQRRKTRGGRKSGASLWQISGRMGRVNKGGGE